MLRRNFWNVMVICFVIFSLGCSDQPSHPQLESRDSNTESEVSTDTTSESATTDTVGTDSATEEEQNNETTDEKETEETNEEESDTEDAVEDTGLEDTESEATEATDSESETENSDYPTEIEPDTVDTMADDTDTGVIIEHPFDTEDDIGTSDSDDTETVDSEVIDSATEAADSETVTESEEVDSESDSTECEEGLVWISEEEACLSYYPSPNDDEVFDGDMGSGDCTAYNTLIGYLWGTPIYSNGPNPYYSGDHDPSYGLPHQCTSFAMRMTCDLFGSLLSTGHKGGEKCNYAIYPRCLGEYKCGHARMWTDNEANNHILNDTTLHRNIGSVPPQAGDIIISNGGDFGHVRIVAEVSLNLSDMYVIIAEQNFRSSQCTGGKRRLSMTMMNGLYTVTDPNSGGVITGWRRVNGASEQMIDLRCQNVCNQAGISCGEYHGCDCGECTPEETCDDICFNANVECGSYGDCDCGSCSGCESTCNANGQCEAESNATFSCYSDNIFWFDSCGSSEEVKQFCDYGCQQDSQICDAPPLLTCEEICNNNLAECGTVIEGQQLCVCGSCDGCANKCNADNRCEATNYDDIICQNGIEYWVDSCDVRGEGIQSCVYGCDIDTNRCAIEPACDPTLITGRTCDVDGVTVMQINDCEESEAIMSCAYACENGDCIDPAPSCEDVCADAMRVCGDYDGCNCGSCDSCESVCNSDGQCEAEANYYTACSNGDLYSFDSCDTALQMTQECEFGCEDGDIVCAWCTDDGTRISTCQGDTLEVTDNCGSPISMDECAYGCDTVSNSCNPAPVPTCEEICMTAGRECGTYDGCECGTCDSGCETECNVDGQCVVASNTYVACYNDDLYSFDSCDQPEAVSETCAYGCDTSIDACNDCIPNGSTTVVCNSNDRVSIDSCGGETTLETCSYQCQNGACVDEPPTCEEICMTAGRECGSYNGCNCGGCYGCESECNSSGQCEAPVYSTTYCKTDYQVWTKDACGSWAQLTDSCILGEETCINGACEPICTSHKEEKCGPDGNVHWYNSCNVIEEVSDYCSSNEECISGTCVSTCTTVYYWSPSTVTTSYASAVVASGSTPTSTKLRTTFTANGENILFRICKDAGTYSGSISVKITSNGASLFNTSLTNVGLQCTTARSLTMSGWDEGDVFQPQVTVTVPGYTWNMGGVNMTRTCKE